MGQAISTAAKGRSATRGIIVTLDALGTIYNFKKPVTVQYLEVAKKCGLKADIKEEDLQNSFKSAYKAHTTRYPNYGKGTNLQTPEQWWTTLVENTFGGVIDRSKIPDGLGLHLYHHFSSGDAYELFSDVQPFLEVMRDIRKQYSGPDNQSLILGIITNSDPRVRNILENLGLMVGRADRDLLMERAMRMTMDPTQGEVKVPWYGAYDYTRDFDFLTTSYEAGSEKPNSRIFLEAGKQAGVVMLGKTDTEIEILPGLAGFKQMTSKVSRARNAVDTTFGMQWIHIGDEIIKDLEGAKNAALEGILIDRDGKHKDVNERVQSLTEISTVINILVQEGFKQSL